MPVVTPEKLIALQRESENVRNICILAHVDHGKTSLTDALIATNGIISPKMAGKIRYLDSRPDEQLRGITMESSAISLCFSMARRQDAESAPVQKDYLINLIDSPGHVDFSSEVSTASRLSDGALVLVDAVEGVCSQTVTVLRQTWMEKLKPILVINKMDRLVTELKMTSAEAYTHLSKLLEQVNAVLGSFFQGERMEDDLQWREKIEARVAAAASSAAADQTQDDASSTNGDSNHIDESATYEEKDDESLYFAPENNNVIFSSAIDGWAFSVGQFAALYEKKLGIKRQILQKCLWGDFYMDPKTKRVLGSKHLKGRNLKPMFVQLVLDNIWSVYNATTGGDNGKGDSSLLEKITKSLSITIPPHILRSRDPRALLTTVFASWLPLSTATLVTVIDRLPSPPAAQSNRMPALIAASPGADYVSPDISQATTRFKTAPNDPMVAFVSKMVSVPDSELPQNKRKGGNTMTAEEARNLARKKRAEIAKAQAEAAAAEADAGPAGLSAALTASSLDEPGDAEEPEAEAEPEHLIGFARLYSGTLDIGDEIYVLPPKFTPADPHRAPEPQKVKVSSLYLLMGRSLEALDSVPAGVVFGIGGLEGHILKSGTLCTQLEGGVNLAGVVMGGEPIVRVALEPEDPSDLAKMIHGMKLLEQSDPCAVYEVMDSGEHVIYTAGELHLERCLKDLRERFARCEIQAGEPIVPFRESIIKAAVMSEPKSKELPRGTVIGITTSKQLSVRLRVRPLPERLTNFLLEKSRAIRHLYAKQKEQEGNLDDSDDEDQVPESKAIEQEAMADELISLKELREGLKSALDDGGLSRDKKAGWSEAIDRITAFGPRRSGPNLLIDDTTEQIFTNFLDETQGEQLATAHANSNGNRGSSRATSANDFVDRVTYAFQLATAQGPLCLEPMQGVAVFVEDISLVSASDKNDRGDIDGNGNVNGNGNDSDQVANENAGRLTGEAIKTVRDSIRQGFMDWSPRLLLAMYSCEIQASTEVLGRVYPTITRRRGRILSEEMKEGTPFFTITAVLPVATSFGFADDIRKKTSGGAQPQLRFAGFEMLDEDPMWVPTTEEELEDLGATADRENVAKTFMDGVRRRKGLVVSGLRREGGEKARTLKR